ITDDFVTFFNGTDAPDVEADGRIEFERVSAGGGFRVAEHDADFHADLVDEDDHAVGALDVGRKLAQGLTHEAGLQTGKGVTHVAFDFGLGYQSRYRVDDNKIHRTGTYQ